MMALILSVGFVVDDAIVMLDNIYRHVEMGEDPLHATLEGSRGRFTDRSTNTRCSSSWLRNFSRIQAPFQCSTSKGAGVNSPVVPLDTLATTKQQVGPQTVNHYGQLPAVTISFGLAPS
jgi:multidrug efflux pump subunit AcrB